MIPDEITQARAKIMSLARKNSGHALILANELISKFPDDPNAWDIRSYVFEVREEFEKAIIDTDVVIKIRPDDVGAIWNKGRYLVNLQNYRCAIEYFSKSIEISIKNKSETVFEISYFFRAFCLCKIARFHEAEADLSHVREDFLVWVDRLRSKGELVEACKNNNLV